MFLNNVSVQADRNFLKMKWTMFLWMIIFDSFADTADSKNDICGKDYMVQIEGKWLEYVKENSKELGWEYKEKIVSNIYLFKCETCTEKSEAIQRFSKTFEGKVEGVEKRECSKLRFVPWLYDTPRPQGVKQFILTKRNEPKFGQTWPYYGMDIQEAWSMGMTGEGIKVAIVDSGVELNHKDLTKNLNQTLSRSFAGDETSDGNAVRLYFYPETDMYTSHGTKAAGLVAAEFGNSVCSAGVAFNATIISLKVFKVDDQPIPNLEISFPDDYITRALEYRRKEIDIYSCSFGLANMFSKSNIHIKAVLKEGITEGRNGKGSIYVFAAGNKLDVYDCNTVPYTNSIYTVTVASVGKGGTKPEYAMPCSSVLISTYGIYTTHDGTRYLETTTLDGKCDNFKGTSASAAIGSGIIALMLQANKNLTWRDVQHILVMSSSFESLQNYRKTSTNGNGLKYNPYFGFGLLNTTKAVLLAQNWTSVPEMMRFAADFKSFPSKKAYVWKINFPSSQRCLQRIEHVRVNVAFNVPEHMENSLEISLRSPAGTRSVLFHIVSRQATSRDIVTRNWNFTSVQFWREKPHGTWTLCARFRGMQHNYHSDFFQFRPGSLTLYGTAKDPYPNDPFAHGPTENDSSEDTDCLTRLKELYSVPFEGALQVDTGVGSKPEVAVKDNKYIFMNIVIIAIEIFVIMLACLSCYLYKTGNCHNKFKDSSVLL